MPFIGRSNNNFENLEKPEKTKTCSQSITWDKTGKKTSKLAVVSVLCGIGGWFTPILFPLAFLLGIIALITVMLKRKQLKGYSYAILAIFLSAFWFLLFLIRFGLD